jgi:polysaccharide biosynthesis/export protein
MGVYTGGFIYSLIINLIKSTTLKLLMKKILYVLLSFIIGFSSCIQKKQLLYMQDIPGEINATYPTALFEYKIQSGDILYVRITTMERAYQEFLERETTSLVDRYIANEASLYLTGYTVNQEGYITLPILSRVQVKGLTIDEAEKSVQYKVDDLFKNASAIVKLANYKISVVGEVARPGAYLNYQNKVTIFDAIATAGNITDFGNRKNVLVMRGTDAGARTYRIDLTSAGALESEAYFLLPNDLVIVEPNDTKVFRLNTPTLTFAFSALSTLLLIINILN